jgi:hypothetical protein
MNEERADSDTGIVTNGINVERDERRKHEDHAHDEHHRLAHRPVHRV